MVEGDRNYLSLCGGVRRAGETANDRAIAGSWIEGLKHRGGTGNLSGSSRGAGDRRGASPRGGCNDVGARGGHEGGRAVVGRRIQGIGLVGVGHTNDSPIPRREGGGIGTVVPGRGDEQRAV